MSSHAILALVADQNSPGNNRRLAAELQFNKLAAEDPSQVAFELIQGACSADEKIDIRQACLLHLKRLVPKFWSMGFESFVGPPIDQKLKQDIRSSLLKLVSTDPNSKVRSGSAYVIVQIAAADYPDEWPDLLVQLYDLARDLNNHTAVVGSLSVLTDLFDDLISEEQFWEGGVGSQLLSYITNLLGQDALPADIKTSALKLYLTVYNTLSSAEAVEVPERKAAVVDHIVKMFMLAGQLLEKSCNATANSLNLSEIYFRMKLYRVIANILSTYRKRVGKDLVSKVCTIMLQDLTYSSNAYKLVALDGNTQSIVAGTHNELDDPARVITNHLAELLSTLSLIQDSLPLVKNYPLEVFEELTRSIVQCAILPAETAEEYVSDFNAYVTEISGLSGVTTARDAVRDYVMDLGDKDAAQLFDMIKNEAMNRSLDWRLQEAYLLLAESAFSNEQAESVGADLQLSQYLASIDELVDQAHPLLVARIFILLPKFIEKFSGKLSVSDFGGVQFKNTYAFASSPSSEESFKLVKASSLVAATFWNQVPGLKLKDMGLESQGQIVQIASDLLDDSEEDTPPVIMEALSVAIDIDQRNAFTLIVNDEYSVIDIIIKAAFKDPANVQLTIDSRECLDTLLKDVSLQEFLQVCDRSLPFVIKIIQEAVSSTAVEYSPKLSLALDLLGNLLVAAPSKANDQAADSFPKDVFDFAFPVLRQLIMKASDDQILQSGAEVFNSLLQKAPKYFVEYSDPETKESGMHILIAVAGKFLSPELSDSAAMNCGLIVASLFENFQAFFDSDFFYQLLEATVRRLVIAKGVVTIENLVMVFCKLVLNASPENLINALTAVNVVMPDSQQQRNGLEAVLPIWFGSFEVTRGYEKIQQNILALGKLYSLNDSRLSSMIVDGDIIPYEGDMIITRSKSKTMPQKYTQIPAPVKILKLLANELGFQCQQPNAEDYQIENRGDDDDNGDDWEDLEDIGVPTYEKLKSYVDSDEEEEDGAPVGDQTVKEMLVQFFKECISKNLGNFQQYYEALDEDEKKILTENVVF
ncbi:hypothetical_protein [Candidozyma auris]|uniref:hypothetical_protein n=1 Tax=Candidozyma auris TaxID=498019 RepID=UPI000D2A1BF9|nr:hypothetical_protein [[Candida] auris]QEO22395.1 hypothetical_protein [[Candida] auris]GBL51196.1 hypothetical protein CAJCM15448_34700 [[Candida] auris]